MVKAAKKRHQEEEAAKLQNYEEQRRVEREKIDRELKELKEKQELRKKLRIEEEQEFNERLRQQEQLRLKEEVVILTFKNFITGPILIQQTRLEQQNGKNCQHLVKYYFERCYSLTHFRRIEEQNMKQRLVGEEKNAGGAWKEWVI